MTIEQMIEIPASRLVSFEVPPQMPVGKAKVLVTPLEELPRKEISLLSMRGSCKGFDTLDAYFARKKADKIQENRKNGNVLGNSL